MDFSEGVQGRPAVPLANARQPSLETGIRNVTYESFPVADRAVIFIQTAASPFKRNHQQTDRRHNRKYGAEEKRRGGTVPVPQSPAITLAGKAATPNAALKIP